MLAIGTVLQGRYQIARFLGQGGMGVVYQAIDTRLGHRPVAVKEMDATLVAPAERQATVAAFQQEARMLARLNHPGIAGVIDYFTQGDFSYFVMEYVEGETLEEALLRAPHGFQEAQALTWAGQLAVVLDYLHRQTPPIIFRDLKPGNIMVQPDGTLKLIDFGIARLFKAGQTHDTIRLGTPGYAPPEQYGHGQTDARSDVYSLGAVVHQLLTGHNPAAAPMRLPPARQLRPDLSPQTEAAVAQALQLDPALRYTSTLAFARALGAPISGPFAAGQGVAGGREPVPAAVASVTGVRGQEHERAAGSSSGWLKPLIAGLGLLALLLVGWLLLRPLLDGDGASPAAGAGTPAAPVVTQVATSPAEEGAAIAEAGAAATTPTTPSEKTPVDQSAAAVASATPAVLPTAEVATGATTQPAITIVVAATATSAAPPTAQPTPCQYQVLAALRGAWAEDLGCPTNAGQGGINTGYAPFERGQMLWREDDDAIYVLYNNNTFARFADVWREGDPDFSCGEQNSPPTPVRGFGRVWCDNQAVRDGLGAVTAYEIGDSASSSQDYVNGSILIAPDGRAFIFLGHASGTWR